MTRGIAGCVAALALACAPIDVRSSVSLQPRPDPVLALGESEQEGVLELEWIQLGPRVLVELRELPVCASTHHVPVTRIEEIERSARGFIAWDFVIAGITGGLASVAFARPQTFSPRLIDAEGRSAFDPTNAYVVGSIFASISALLITAGIVNSIRARDETRYAPAYRVEHGPPQRCSGLAPRTLADRMLELDLGDGALIRRARADSEGRARFELGPSWPASTPAPEGPRVAAKLSIAGDSRVLEFELVLDWQNLVDAATGTATSHDPQALQVREIEGQPEPSPLPGFGGGE